MTNDTPVPAPMEALLAAELPDGDGWQYEPKWDGFRCLARRDGDEVTLTSKSGKPLARYFPEVVEMLGELKANAVPARWRTDHPGWRCPLFRCAPAAPAPGGKPRPQAREGDASRTDGVRSLGGGRQSLSGLPLSERRARLEHFFRKNRAPGLHLSPMTCDRASRLRWLERSGGALDGVIAKRADQEYRSGERAMIKVKQQRTADCVVGGFRYAEKKKEVGSLLLGLYDDAGQARSCRLYFRDRGCRPARS